MVTLDIAHLDLEAATVSVRLTGHGSERKTKDLPAPTVEALREWVAVRGSEPGPLFTSFDRAEKGDGHLSEGGPPKPVEEDASEGGDR